MTDTLKTTQSYLFRQKDIVRSFYQKILQMLEIKIEKLKNEINKVPETAKKDLQDQLDQIYVKKTKHKEVWQKVEAVTYETFEKLTDEYSELKGSLLIKKKIKNLSKLETLIFKINFTNKIKQPVMKYPALDRTKIPRLVDELNQLLANYHIYYQNLKNFHWNLKGRNFIVLHQKFETLYKRAQEDIDEIAERIRILEFRPLSTLQKYLLSAQIEEIDDLLNDLQMVEKIIADQKFLIGNMRSVLRKATEVGDEGTVDLIGGLLRFTEKQVWMLDSWINVKSEVHIENATLS